MYYRLALEDHNLIFAEIFAFVGGNYMRIIAYGHCVRISSTVGEKVNHIPAIMRTANKELTSCTAD